MISVVLQMCMEQFFAAIRYFDQQGPSDNQGVTGTMHVPVLVRSHSPAVRCEKRCKQSFRSGRAAARCVGSDPERTNCRTEARNDDSVVCGDGDGLIEWTV